MSSGPAPGAPEWVGLAGQQVALDGGAVYRDAAVRQHHRVLQQQVNRLQASPSATAKAAAPSPAASGGAARRAYEAAHRTARRLHRISTPAAHRTHLHHSHQDGVKEFLWRLRQFSSRAAARAGAAGAAAAAARAAVEQRCDGAAQLLQLALRAAALLGGGRSLLLCCRGISHQRLRLVQLRMWERGKQSW